MALGSVQLDSLISSTKTLSVDNLATSSDITTSQTAWTVVSTAQTVAANKRYLVDSSAASFTLTLPASPTAGQFVEFADQEGCFATYNVTLGRNSSNILGTANDLVLNVDNAVVRLIYSGDATQGWLVK